MNNRRNYVTVISEGNTGNSSTQKLSQEQGQIVVNPSAYAAAVARWNVVQASLKTAQDRIALQFEGGGKPTLEEIKAELMAGKPEGYNSDVDKIYAAAVGAFIQELSGRHAAPALPLR